MLRLAELRDGAVDTRPRVDQVGGIELVAAVVALVAAGLRVAADRACALDVPVGQRVPRGGRERDEHLALDDRAVLVEGAEQVLDDPLVVERRRAGEQVVRKPEPLEVLAKRLVVVVGDLTGGLPFPVRGHHHGRAVLVRPAHHEDVVASQPVIAGEHVGRDPESRHVAKVTMPRCVRPRGRNQDLLPGRAHRRPSYEGVQACPGAAARAQGRERREPGRGRRAIGATRYRGLCGARRPPAQRAIRRGGRAERPRPPARGRAGRSRRALLWARRPDGKRRASEGMRSRGSGYLRVPRPGLHGEAGTEARARAFGSTVIEDREAPACEGVTEGMSRDAGLYSTACG